MDTPFDPLLGHPYLWLLIALGMGSSSAAGQWAIQRSKLRNYRTDRPIVDFELAGSAHRAREMLTAWGPGGQWWFSATLALDFVFLVSYGTLLGVASVLGARAFAHWSWAILPSIARLAAWGAAIAASADVLENFVLTYELVRPPDGDTAPRFARRFARLKFRLASFVIPIAVVCLLFDVLGCRASC